MAGWYLSWLAANAIKTYLPRAYGVDKNFAPLLSQVARYGILIFAPVTALNLLGVANSSIITVLGAAGTAVALALQGTLANIAAGIMLIVLRPIAIGEFIRGRWRGRRRGGNRPLRHQTPLLEAGSTSSPPTRSSGPQPLPITAANPIGGSTSM
ncbi:mechanosensitive ion channel [Devosia sp. A8/3-2]|nr:mechanosensitive ion channel [Devosia sp. A8/3-2]